MSGSRIDSQPAIEQAVAAIYRAASGVASWDESLSLLSDRMGVLGAQMIGVEMATGMVRFSHASARIPGEAEIAYVRTYHKVDPRVPLVLPKPPGEWLYDQDVFPAEMALADPYYRDLLIPIGGRYSAAAKLCQRDGEITYIAFLSYPEPLGFGDHQREFIAQIGYHLQQAALIYQHTRRMGTTAVAGEELLRRIRRPTYVLAPGARIEIANESGRKLLTSRNGLVADGDVLAATDAATQRRLEAALMTLFAPDVGPRRRQVLRIGGPPAKNQLVLSLTPFAPSETMFTFGTEARVMAIVHAVDETGTGDPMLWEAAFDLTLAEAQVAVLLTAGVSVKQIAARRGVSVPTVRSQIRALLEKTGARHQVDLVARLLAVTALR